MNHVSDVTVNTCYILLYLFFDLLDYLFLNSVYKWESILEIYSDAHTFGLKSAKSAAVNNSNMAISWLETTFPEVAQEATDRENLSTIKAHSHALFDASLALQVCEIMVL